MSAPVDASSSEDEEALAKLKEAAVESSSFTKYNSHSTEVDSKDDKEKKCQNISLRPEKQKAREGHNPVSHVFKASPGVKKHIAKKLSAALDSEIDTSDKCFCPLVDGLPLETTGVKLFHHSARCISTEEEQVVTKPRKRRPPSSSSDSSEDEKLAEAAVSHDFVVKQSRQSCVTDLRPPDVTVVCGNRTSQLDVTSTGPDCVTDNKENGATSVELLGADNDITASVEHHKKKKKKKKHKHTKEEG